MRALKESTSRGFEHGLIKFATVFLFVAHVTGCASRPDPQPQPVPEQAPVAVPAPVAPPRVRAPVASAARSVDAYKREVAQRIHEVSYDLVFAGAPPNPLRSIVVVNVAIDGRGGLIDARVMRDNGDTELTRVALESVRRAAPYAVPVSALARRGRIEFFETWLFREDGRFQLRTLAEAQQQ
jgi:protein TonB